MAEHIQEIKLSLLRNIETLGYPKVSTIAQRFGLSREAIYKHLRSLVAEEIIYEEGQGKKKQYHIPVVEKIEKIFDLINLDEMIVWDQVAGPVLDKLSAEDRKICQYGFTEMVNNAIDHSEGKQIQVKMVRTAVSITISIEDDGIGIFEKIARALQLEDPRLAILELSKGKFTTDPSRHSGEGIFFTSRMFDIFVIRSKLLRFVHHDHWGEGDQDWLVNENEKITLGTQFFMELLIPSGRTMESTFSRFHTGEDDYAFSKTHVPLALAQVGNDYLISRSQARRVLTRFDRFTEVMLDFSGVSTIGQAFADEIFRVFQNEHPDIKIVCINTIPQVSKMIKRVQENQTNK